MKTALKYPALALIALILAVAPLRASARDTIVYTKGPSFIFGGWEYEGTSLDLNQDGTLDFNFQWGAFLCTADIPVSACSSSFYVVVFGTNAMIHQRGEATLLRFGESIGSVIATNRAWDDTDYYSRVSDYYFSARYSTRGYGGPIVSAGVGYIGVRFMAADGLHYGWIRLRTPTGPEFGPTVMDWAYETRPNTPIRAGDISSDRQALYLVADFPNGNSGSLILTEGQLRSELMLNGPYASAKLTRNPRAHGKPIADLGQPLATRTNYTSFFRDVKLNRGETIQLLLNPVYVSVDGGALVGRVYLRE